MATTLRLAKTSVVRFDLHTVLSKAQISGVLIFIVLAFFPPLHRLNEYLFFSLLAVWLFQPVQNGRLALLRSPIDLPLLLFVGWVLLTVPFALDPSYSFTEWRKLTAKVLAFYWALAVFREQPSTAITRGMVGAVLLGTAGLGLYAIWDFVEVGGTWQDRTIRAGAPNSDYNWLSTYIVMVFPLIIAVAVVAGSLYERLLASSVAIVALLAQLFSYTRAAWLGMAVQGIVYALLTARRRIIVWTVSLICGAVVVLALMSYLGFQRQTLDPWTWTTRWATWKFGIAEIMTHPIVGLGYGDETFAMRFAHSQDVGLLMGLHSALLMIAVGSGLPAAVFLIWIFYGAFAALMKDRARLRQDSILYAVVLGVALMIVGFAVRNLFAYMFAGNLAYLFWILIAAGCIAKEKLLSAGLRP